MFCSKCGNEIADDAGFCPKCGTPLNRNATANSIQISLILGILGIIFAILFALVGHILSIIGIVVGYFECRNTGRVAGLRTSIIGELCSILSSVLGVILAMK